MPLQGGQALTARCSVHAAAGWAAYVEEDATRERVSGVLAQWYWSLSKIVKLASAVEEYRSRRLVAEQARPRLIPRPQPARRLPPAPWAVRPRPGGGSQLHRPLDSFSSGTTMRPGSGG